MGRLGISIALAALLALSTADDAQARGRKHGPSVRQAQTAPAPSRADPDDLYRRRGYGIGGSAFGLGPGGTAMAGTCADLRFAASRTCGRGYGIYGNGLGYGFGF